MRSENRELDSFAALRRGRNQRLATKRASTSPSNGAARRCPPVSGNPLPAKSLRTGRQQRPACGRLHRPGLLRPPRHQTSCPGAAAHTPPPPPLPPHITNDHIPGSAVGATRITPIYRSATPSAQDRGRLGGEKRTVWRGVHRLGGWGSRGPGESFPHWYREGDAGGRPRVPTAVAGASRDVERPVQSTHVWTSTVQARVWRRRPAS